METKHIALDYLHGDHRKWLDELDFCKEEIAYFEHRLEQMVQTINDRSLLSIVEHFQNQFIREREVIDGLNRDVKKEAQELAMRAQSTAFAEEDFQVQRHVALGDQMIRFNELYADLKRSFNRFSVRWMENKVT